MGTGVSLVIPAYNEERGVTVVLSRLSEAMAASGLQTEILVVDDGSTDSTRGRAEAAGVRVLHHLGNRGYGAAIKTGIRHARYPLICITDADGSYPVESIPQLVEELTANGCDMIVGARVGRDAAIPWVRRPAKWVLGWLAKLVAGEPIPDLNSGLRVFWRDVALRFFNYLPDGFSFTTTITLAMLSNGYLIGYTPIAYHARIGRSKIRPIHDTLNFIRLILSIALYFAPLKIFLTLSGFLLLLGLAWAMFSKLVLGQLADVSTLIIGVAALQVGMMGLLAELINRRLPGLNREEA